MPFTPGRIEFLGKHTDYCGGESIVCPIDRGFGFDFGGRRDTVVTLENRDTGETLGFDSADPGRRTGWINYAVTVAARLRSNFGAAFDRGADISCSSDLPAAAGLSSSSALMITVFRALAEVNGIERTETYRSNIRGELDLADYLGCVENGRSFRGLGGSGGVGTFGGSQDHAAIVAGRPSRLTRFAFGPLRRISDLAFPDDQCFVVASSGVVAEKSGAARGDYNRVALQAAAVTRRFPGRTLASVIEEIGIAGMDDVIRDRCTEYPAAELVRRVRQFYEESVEIIPAVAELIATGRIGATGDLVDRSQFNAESMLGNQVDETVFLHRSARTLGAVAASAFGAGFGGSVYALVGSSDAGAFLEDWRKAYERRFPQRRPQFFKTRVSGIA